jgi:hypothetical protein
MRFMVFEVPKGTVCEWEEEACQVVTPDVCRVLEILSRLTTNDFVALPAATCSDYSGPLKGLGLNVGLDSRG